MLERKSKSPLIKRKFVKGCAAIELGYATSNNDTDYREKYGADSAIILASESSRS